MPARRRPARLRAFRAILLSGALLAAGCAGWQSGPPLSDAPVAVHGVPFFPQRQHHCGPAALATVLGAGGVDVQPDELARAVYLPGREGSLQVEMLAAARRRGFMAVQVGPDGDDGPSLPAAIVAELQAGRPVLVLQNLGLEFWPFWHYAVVVGYQPDRDRFVLRSGRERRRLVGRARLATTLERAGDWAVVVLEPGTPPAGLAARRYLQAAADLENTGAHEAALAAFRAAAEAWPDRPSGSLGVANNLYYLGRLDAAEAAYRALLADHPGHAVGVHNLATLLIERGRACEARPVVAAVPAGDAAPLVGTARRLVADACPD